MTDPQTDLAIIGMAGRYATASDLSNLESALEAGRDLITRGSPLWTNTGADSRTVAAWGTMRDRQYDLAGIETPIPPNLDFRHGILFEVLRSAVRDAGLRLEDIGHTTSVYAGYARTRDIPRSNFADVYAYDPTFAASFFSYLHDLRGESIMIDATCATGLVGVDLAAASLTLRKSSYALVGAISIIDGTDGEYEASSKTIYSPTGFCRPFDVRADGTVPGDGAGAILLRRLEDAVRDGDPIYSVIKGVSVNNDGRRKPGYVIPSIDGKVDVVQRGLLNSRVDGSDLGLIEAHGVGIPVNDRIEATALIEALGAAGGPLAFGSIKATTGHTDTAAGLAAVIKVSLSLSRGCLYATPNTEEMIQTLADGGTRFELLPTTRPWDDRPRRAGVMSAGIGGVNAFAVLESAPVG